MTKAYFRSLLKNTLAQVDKTSRYHDTYLDHLLEQCVNSIYYQVHAQDPKALGQYTKKYKTQSAAAGDIDKYEYTLPVKLVPLPDKRGGVRDITCESLYATYFFVPVTDQEMNLMRGSQATGLVTTSPSLIYYSVSYDVVEFWATTFTALISDTLRFDLLVAFTSLGDTDEVPLPYGKNVEVVKMALEILGVVPPKDLLDNNSDVR